MASKLDEESRMSIRVLQRRGVAIRETARILGVTEGAVRYHLRRQREGATDGRSRQVSKAEALRDPILRWVEARRSQGQGLNLAALHEWLVEEHAFEGSLRSVQRFVRRTLPPPKQRARRRVETPPGAQAQADWAVFPSVWVAGAPRRLYAFELELSFSRKDAVVWAERKDQLSWHAVHNGALQRLDGVPATVRVDNEKTAVSRGAGAWGVLNPAYRRYAEVARFHIDPCPPRAPHTKGKVERRIRDLRLRADPSRRHWNSLDELQEWTDEQVEQSTRRRLCPVTGSPVAEAWEEEKRALGALPELPEPFDVMVRRTVSDDCHVSFESRRYPVPFAYWRKVVEVRGCARHVQILHGSELLRSYPRHTKERVLIDPSCYEGPSTEDVLAPVPLGRVGRRLQEIAAMEPEARPIDLYAALAEVAR